MREVEHKVPENDDKTIKNVVDAADVSERTFGDNLQRHLNNEQAAKKQVAVLQHLR